MLHARCLPALPDAGAVDDDAVGAHGSYPAGHLDGLLDQVVCRHHLLHNTPFLGLLRGQGVGQQRQQHCSLQGEDAGQPGQAAAEGPCAASRVGQLEVGVFGSNDEVAVEHDLEAAAVCVAVDGCYYGFLAGAASESRKAGGRIVDCLCEGEFIEFLYLQAI